MQHPRETQMVTATHEVDVCARPRAGPSGDQRRYHPRRNTAQDLATGGNRMGAWRVSLVSGSKRWGLLAGGGRVVADDGFEELYRVRYGVLAAQLHAYLGDAAEAEDVVQEAFLRAWQRWDAVSQFDDPIGWVRRVAWNLARSRWRHLMVVA